jgi:GTP-binding protein
MARSASATDSFSSFSCTRPEALPASYTRYLVNGLRADFDLPGVPIRISYKKGENPFAPRKKRKQS